MSFGWQNLQKLAEKLKQETDEASKRAAISRIYYAAFWRARDFLMEDGFVRKVNGDAGDGTLGPVTNVGEDGYLCKRRSR